LARAKPAFREDDMAENLQKSAESSSPTEKIVVSVSDFPIVTSKSRGKRDVDDSSNRRNNQDIGSGGDGD
jgi:hypothetical protein